MTRSHWILIAFGVGVLLIIGVTIYAKRVKRDDSGSSGVGNALMELQGMLEPEKAAIVEMKREEKSEEKEDGAPREPDGSITNINKE